jgi:hypothetical protein
VIPYVIAALVLLAALALFSMAAGHKTILDPHVERSMIERLDRLTPDAQGRWGNFSVAQMLRHVAAALRMSLGDLDVPRRGGPLRLFPIKQLIVFVLPFPKGAPTSPVLLTKDALEFAVERDAVRSLLSTFATREVARWPDHPAFGPLNRDQWGVLVWKHVDHHFRQFGV